MLVKTFNLRLDSETLQYDDSILIQFSKENDVLSMKTQFFYYKEEPIWSVMVTYRKHSKPSELVKEVYRKPEKLMPSRKGENPPKPKMTEEQQKSYERLRIWRNETARTMGHPPSNLFNNRQLQEIVELNPKSVSQLTKVHGVGAYKSSTYGQEILALLSEIDQKSEGSNLNSIGGDVVSVEKSTGRKNILTEKPTGGENISTGGEND